jgi:EAL domain-containing protein (putative c-di-GMP-specific phosphodiesterase class I)
LHIPVLAEGVEEASQLRIVAEEGCSAIQGYLIGRPERQLADPAQVSALIDGGTRRAPEVSLVA